LAARVLCQKAYEIGTTNSVIGRIRQKSEDPDQAHRYLGLELSERFELALSDVGGYGKKNIICTCDKNRESLPT
jgi:hypothetical protein